MDSVILKILPLIFIFLLGFISKYFNFLKKENAESFLKLVFYVAMPALILTSVSKVVISYGLLLFPIVGILISSITIFISIIYGKFYNVHKPIFGTLVAGTSILNVGFVLQFLFVSFGPESLPKVLMFDLGTGISAYTFVYYFACKYGGGEGNNKYLIKKILIAPPIWRYYWLLF